MNRSIVVLVVYLIGCLVLVPAQASAYIDPSNTTFILQAAIGLGVAVATGVSIYWRKARKKISKAIGKDDSSRQDESDEIDAK